MMTIVRVMTALTCYDVYGVAAGAGVGVGVVVAVVVAVGVAVAVAVAVVVVAATDQTAAQLRGTFEQAPGATPLPKGSDLAPFER